MFPDLLALPSSLLKSQDDQDADAWMETVDLKAWRIKAFHIFTRKISGDHQLRLVDYPIIYKILYNPDGTRISSINSIILKSIRFVFAEILIDIRLPKNTIE